MKSEQGKFYTYIYKNPITLEPFYVGKGSGKRYREYTSGRGLHFKNSVKKSKPVVEITYRESEIDALIHEQLLIGMFGRRDQGTGILINQTDGGDNPPNRKGKPLSENHKKKLSKSLKQARIRLGNWHIPSFAGHKHTEESKKKTGQAQIGNKHAFVLKGRPLSAKHKKALSKPKQRKSNANY